MCSDQFGDRAGGRTPNDILVLMENASLCYINRGKKCGKTFLGLVPPGISFSLLRCSQWD
jgi:hypothetical protein